MHSWPQIGGQLSEDEARELILAKLYDIAHAELERYLNAEKRSLVLGVENLWDKYAVSSREFEQLRLSTVVRLDGFLNDLGYFGAQKMSWTYSNLALCSRGARKRIASRKAEYQQRAEKFRAWAERISSAVAGSPSMD